jgi:hypothetical protein
MTNFRTLLDLLRKDDQGADPQFLRDGIQLLAPEAGLEDLFGRTGRERT